MKLYANLLGVWTELTYKDSINSQAPEFFINEIFKNFKSKEFEEYMYKNNNFVQIIKDDNVYDIHISQIQFIKKYVDL